MVLASVALAGASAACVVAAWADWRHGRVAQWLVGALAAGWALTWLAAPTAFVHTALVGAVCAVGALGVGGALWAMEWLGAGDVKLAAALGLWLGPADFGLALIAAGLLLLALAGIALGLGGDLVRRDLPVGIALAPPSVALLAFRALDVASPAPST